MIGVSASLWIVGCGNMGGALVRRWLAAGLDPGQITVIDPAPPSIAGVTWLTSPPVGSPDLLLLGVKPQIVDQAAAAYAGVVTNKTVVISILAGVECADLDVRFPGAKAIVRTMPNLPVAIGKGVTALFAKKASPEVRGTVDALFAPTGIAEWLTSEDQFHAVIAVSGSGPAFAYRFIGALADGGAALGLPADQALRLARATVEGAAALCTASGEDPAELARQVTSPGGTTAAGLAVMDEGGTFASLIAATQVATAARSETLAEAAKTR
jgi:pyrroline-5-carboxylate reductase